MKEKFKGLGSFVLRFGLSVVLLGWLFSKVDFKDLWAAIKDSDPFYMTSAAIVFFCINFLILWRWIIFMKALGLKFKGFSSVRWFFIGLFCNLFLPTSVGGDVVKGMGLARETGSKPKVFAAIVLDRLAGFAGIVLIAFLAFLGGRKIVQDSSIMISIVCMTLISLCLVIVFFSHRVFSWTTHAFSLWPKVKEGLMNVHYDIVLMKGKQKEVVFTVLLSVVAQVILAFEFYLTAKGMHQDILLIYFIIFSPLVCVATALPSIGGLGVREVGWVYLLSKVGVSQSVALGLSLINFAFMVGVGIIGGILYVVTLSSGRVQHHSSGVPLSQPSA
jgi:uncharacterized protein (TIRG00374 family)